MEGSLEKSFHTSDKTFNFAKVNIHGNIFKPNLHELIETEIPRVLKTAKEIKLKKKTISLTDVHSSIIDNRPVIIGHLTNSKKETRRVKEGDFTYLHSFDKEFANSAVFVYDLKSEILAFSTANGINVDDFIKYFTKLLSADNVVGEVIIKILPQEYDIINEIKVLEKITFIKFQLIHPNPPSSKHYNKFEEMVKETKAKEAVVSFKDQKDGLNIHTNSNGEITNDTIKDGIEMVESGYGDVEIKGENYSYVDSGVQRKTKKKVTKKKIFNSSKSRKILTVKSENFEDALNKIINFIKSLTI